eukprot:TRINITY_DN18862_c0_g1_i4.p1 TRINITY_DN18862_c0_g1~~TRINITY_DN18862_c0_g1_i4.p1  ORF type:complete len:277 (-),score=41.29 TRINITY_DN18862_c0_g1_i4:9-812(-)
MSRFDMSRSAKSLALCLTLFFLLVWSVFLMFPTTSSAPPVAPEAHVSPLHDNLLQVSHPLGRLFVPHPPLPATLRAHDWDTLARGNVEDRSFLVFLAGIINVSAYPKRIYYDLGLRDYKSSLKWMLDNYPAQFDEVYGFECNTGTFKDEKDPRIPEGGAHYFIGKCADTKDGENAVDFPRLLHETCRMQDFCVIKMDIEGAEWTVLPKMEEKGVHSLVDELLVEIHFQDPHMAPFGWNKFGPQTIEDGRKLLNHWRHDLNVYTNPWP